MKVYSGPIYRLGTLLHKVAVVLSVRENRVLTQELAATIEMLQASLVTSP